MEFLESLGYGLQHPSEREGRIAYPCYGSVTNVSDDQKLGRVKARLDGQADNEESDWLDPAWPGSIEAIPNQGDQVFVIFAYGDPHRGIYLWHPTSKTKGRPTEAMLLATTFAAMWNQLYTAIQQLKIDIYTTIATHTHPYALGTTSTSAALAALVAPTFPGQIKDANGSPVAGKSGDQTALSGKAKVR